MAKGEWIEVNERTRTYIWAKGSRSWVRYTNVRRIKVSESGNHYLECDQGHIIVAPGWSRIELDIDGWTF